MPIKTIDTEQWAVVPRDVLDRFPEINPSNYDHDDACRLNAWGVELVLAAAPRQVQANVQALVEALEQIASYPTSRAAELSSAGCRAIARKALAAFDQGGEHGN